MAADHYATLGVDASATAAELRTAYLKLARANHPDKFSGPARDRAETKMRSINEAWNVLGVAHKRREYDAGRSSKSGPSAGGASAGAGRTQWGAKSSGATRGHAHFQPFDDEPIRRQDVDLDPTPIQGSKGIPRWVPFLPILLFVGGLLTIGFATMVSASGLFALGVIALILGGISFLMLPLLVMSRAERDPDL